MPEPLPGITTWANPQKAVYLKENGTSAVEQVGVFSPKHSGETNKMTLRSEGFANLGVSALERCAQSDSEWVSIDEIGYLENECESYQNAIRKLMEQKRLAAVVRKQDMPFLRELCSREDVFLVDLDQPYGEVGCVILASGLGRRFGGNKLMADFHGQPMLCRILDATEGIFFRRVVVTRHEAVAALCRERGIDVVRHELPHRSDTVRLGLERMPGVAGCMFCAGDQPLLHRETVAALALAAAQDRQSIWRTAFEGTEGSPVLFPRWSFPELLTLPEGKGGGIVAKKYPERLRMVSVRDEYELKDVDSPEDLLDLLER